MKGKMAAPVSTLIRLAAGLALLTFVGASGLAHAQASLESPSAGSFQESGVSLIRGWVCQASRIEISIDNRPVQRVAYGTVRPDTQTVCGDSNNGFGLTINWGDIGEGAHTLRALADGVEFANVDFIITTLGGSFLTKLIGEYTLKDFPTPGSSPKVAWSEPHQNFVFTKNLTVSANPNPPSSPRALLESPTQGSSESGVGLIRGWACDAGRVEVSINGAARLQTASGTTRADTQATCGDVNNGFGLTINWNEIGDGVHNLRAFADNVEFANVNFAITTLGGKFLTGLNSKQTLADFPSAGKTTTVSWSEPQLNFVIARTTATEPKVGILSAITDRLNRFATTHVGAESADILGVAAAKDSAGEATQLNSLAWTDSSQGIQADVALTADGLPAAYRDSAGVEARFSNFTATTATVGFFDRNGNPQGQPVTVPINGGFLQSLQAVAQRIANNAQSAAANQAKQLGFAKAINAVGAEQSQTQEAASGLRFTPGALLINAQWYGSLTTGEVLCAVQTASAQAGILSQIAAKGCQSKLITAVLQRANAARQALAAFSPDVVDPVAQQALQFTADVADAPCAENAASAACLIPAAIIVEEREETDEPIKPNPVTPPPAQTVPAAPEIVSASDGVFTDRVRITWSAVSNATYYQVFRESQLLGSPTQTTITFDDNTAHPSTTYSYAVNACNNMGCSSVRIDTGFVARTEQPTIYYYVGQSEICFSETANYGARGSCGRCATGAASAALQSSGVLTINSPDFDFNAEFDASGNCTAASLTLGSPYPLTGSAASGSLSASYSIYSGSIVVANVVMSGSYNTSAMTASGSTGYTLQLSNGQFATVSFSESIVLQRSTGGLAATPASADGLMPSTPALPAESVFSGASSSRQVK